MANIVGTYNPSKDVISYLLDIMRKCIDGFLPKYENFVIMGGLYFLTE